MLKEILLVSFVVLVMMWLVGLSVFIYILHLQIDSMIDVKTKSLTSENFLGTSSNGQLVISPEIKDLLTPERMMPETEKYKVARVANLMGLSGACVVDSPRTALSLNTDANKTLETVYKEINKSLAPMGAGASCNCGVVGNCNCGPVCKCGANCSCPKTGSAPVGSVLESNYYNFNASQAGPFMPSAKAQMRDTFEKQKQDQLMKEHFSGKYIKPNVIVYDPNEMSKYGIHVGGKDSAYPGLANYFQNDALTTSITNPDNSPAVGGFSPVQFKGEKYAKVHQGNKPTRVDNWTYQNQPKTYAGELGLYDTYGSDYAGV